MVKITLMIICTTDDSVKVSDGSIITWLPKSLISVVDGFLPDLYSDLCEYEFEVPEWLAIERGLV